MKTWIKNKFRIILIFFLLFQSVIINKYVAQERTILDEMHSHLVNNVLGAWYPKIIDSTYGGFLTDFNYKWEPFGEQNKMLVSQARHIWTTAKMADFIRDEKYNGYSEIGFKFLKEEMYDSENGGFHLLVNREGHPLEINKTSYSLSFSIYALSAYYKMSGDSSALNLAKDTFFWLEKYAHDNENGGYYDLLTYNGKLQNLHITKSGNRYFRNPEWKDQNSSIHLLEAFTELYSIWPNELVKHRLKEMFLLVRDVITTEKGYLTLHLTNNWLPISFRDSSETVREANYFLDHVSFGHDVETAYLLLEASHLLELENDIETKSIIKKMVDHAIQYGFDKYAGGFFYQGYYFDENEDPQIIDSTKEWWVQAEGLNSLLLMSILFPTEKIYYILFLQQWDYIKKYQIDYTYKGWYSKGLDYNPEFVNKPKAFKWKANYHNIRSLMNCISLLKNIRK